MPEKLTPLKFDLIEQGQLKQDVDTVLLQLQKILVRHVRQYGERAKNAVSKMTIEVALVCLDPKPGEETFGVIAKVKTSLPAAPAYSGILLPGVSDDGSECLECRLTGSTPDTPVQKLLCTDDGKKVDPDSGEIIEPETVGS